MNWESESPLRPAEVLWYRYGEWRLAPIRTAHDSMWRERGWKMKAFSVDGMDWTNLGCQEDQIRLVIAALRGEHGQG